MKNMILTAVAVASLGAQALAESPTFSVQKMNQDEKAAQPDNSGNNSAIDLKKAKAVIDSETAQVDAALKSIFTGQVNSVVIGDQIVLGAVDFAIFGATVPGIVEYLYKAGDAMNQIEPMRIRAKIDQLALRQADIEKQIATGQTGLNGVTAEMKDLEFVTQLKTEAEAELEKALSSSAVKAGFRVKVTARLIQGASILFFVVSDGTRFYIVQNLGRNPGLSPVVTLGRQNVPSVNTQGASDTAQKSVEKSVESAKKGAKDVQEYVQLVINDLASMLKKN
jgi:hypothetical protein